MNPKTEVHFTESKYKDTVGSQESRCGRRWGPENFWSQVPIFLCTPAFLLGLFQLSLSFRTYGRLIAATGNSQACVTTEKLKHMASLCSGSRFPRQGPIDLCWEVAVSHCPTETMWAASSQSFPTETGKTARNTL